MDWIESMRQAIAYIEENLTQEISIRDVAQKVYLSEFYFQKGFSMLCGYTVGEYIRNRRLTLAGTELSAADARIIDVALKYGYDSPDSFAKAFARFHGISPSSAKKNGAALKAFAPLRIHFSLKGGTIMEYKIVEKEAFTILGVSRNFSHDKAYGEIPKFWTEHYQTEKSKIVCGMYGVCVDTQKNSGEFEYLIADNYIPWNDIPEGFVTRVFPKGTWAVFACKGPMPTALQEVNTKIFSEWLPNCKEYEMAGGYNIEMYSNPCDYPKGNADENYRSEIWIPVRRK